MFHVSLQKEIFYKNLKKLNLKVDNLNKQEQKAKNKLFKANMAQRNLDICVLNYKLAKNNKNNFENLQHKNKSFFGNFD